MIESPVIQLLKAEWWHEAILDNLKTRFDTVPADVRRLLSETNNDKKLKRLHKAAVACNSMRGGRHAHRLPRRPALLLAEQTDERGQLPHPVVLRPRHRRGVRPA